MLTPTSKLSTKQATLLVSLRQDSVGVYKPLPLEKEEVRSARALARRKLLTLTEKGGVQMFKLTPAGWIVSGTILSAK